MSNSTDPRTVIRDRVAEAICERVKGRGSWEKMPEGGRNEVRRWADAAIAAHLEALEEAARGDRS